MLRILFSAPRFSPMNLVSFFVRRILTGAFARVFTNFLVKRFRVSPQVANLLFVVIAELLARGSESPKVAGRGFRGFGARKPK